MQTLRQIAACCAGEGETVIPALRIEDKPFFAYRGMMLDVCRHFRTVEEVKRYLDILSLHKVVKTEDVTYHLPAIADIK